MRVRSYACSRIILAEEFVRAFEMAGLIADGAEEFGWTPEFRMLWRLAKDTICGGTMRNVSGPVHFGWH